MRVRMLDSESARLTAGEPQVHLLAGHEYDVPAALATAWVNRAPPLCELVGSNPELPPGYTIEGGQGGYYTVKDADGHIVPGPSNRKWQGADGAAQGAWTHFNATEDEE